VTAWICRTCGVQQADAPQPPPGCAICEDERQYVPAGGQVWTSLSELAEAGYRTELREQEPGLLGIGVQPSFGIGQRALLVQTPAGNLLWDPPGFLDDEAIARVREAGPLAAISSSHPHFYGVQMEWSHAFDRVPVLIPAADQEWIMRPDPAVQLWSGTREVLPGVTLVQCGGHFPGSAVVHWRDGAEGHGALLVGDTVTVVPDTRYVSFMRSYPNLIPLPARDIEHIRHVLAPHRYDRIYGGWWDRVTTRDGQAAVQRSADRYLRWLHGDAPDR
jgi:glyoxylase-like metal-dependent hydrolase (beta-lactamase superfamily II)